MSKVDEALDLIVVTQVGGEAFAMAETVELAKQALLAWHREEVEKLIPKKKNAIQKPKRIGTGHTVQQYASGYNQAIDDIRASLEVSDA